MCLRKTWSVYPPWLSGSMSNVLSRVDGTMTVENDTRSVAVGLLIDVFEKDLKCVSAMPGVDLCPMYSVGLMEQ